MKNFGFTIAEVIVTLSIIGVIAALTLPSLQVNVQRQSVGPALAKAINTLENANRMLLTQENARNLTEVCTGNYLDCLVNNNVLKATSSTNNRGFRNYNLQSDDTIAVNATKYTSDDGIDLYSGSASNMENSIAGRFHPECYLIHIDVNGQKQPNALGRDIFRVWANASGDIFAIGSDEHRVAMPNAASWRGTCDADGVTNAANCAGSVVDNGYRVIYPF